MNSDELKKQRNRLDRELRRAGRVRKNFTRKQLKQIKKGKPNDQAV